MEQIAFLNVVMTQQTIWWIYSSKQNNVENMSGMMGWKELKGKQFVKVERNVFTALSATGITQVVRIT